MQAEMAACKMSANNFVLNAYAGHFLMVLDAKTMHIAQMQQYIFWLAVCVHNVTVVEAKKITVTGAL